jgi:hypothetical protein
VRRELLAWLLAKKEDHVGGGDSGFGLYALLSSLLAEVVINHSRQLQQQVREREKRRDSFIQLQTSLFPYLFTNCPTNHPTLATVQNYIEKPIHSLFITRAIQLSLSSYSACHSQQSCLTGFNWDLVVDDVDDGGAI